LPQSIPKSSIWTPAGMFITAVDTDTHDAAVNGLGKDSEREAMVVQDTGDTRETPAIDVCKGLMADNAKINIYDPKVTEAQIHNDLSLDKFMWDHPSSAAGKTPRQNSVSCFKDAYAVRTLGTCR